MRKEPSRLSNEAWSDNDKSPEKSQAVMPKSRTTPSLRNYMDPVVAASTPPRIVSDFVRKSIARMSPAPESKAEDEAEEPKEDEEDAEEEEELDEGDEADISRDEFSPPPPKSHLTPSASRQSLSRMRRQSEIKQAPGQQIGAASKARQLLWTALLLVFLSYGTWYMQESKALGFCDPRSASNSIVRARHDAVLEAKRASSYLEDGEVDLDGPLLPAFLRPSCTPCPSHGICANGELEGCADSDYVLRDPLLAHIPLVRSIVPPSMTAPTCVPDTHRLVLAAELAGAMNHRLAIWRGSVECGTAPHTGSSKKSLSPSLPEDTLRADLAARRDQTVVDDAYFAQLWTLALDDALRSGAIVRDASGQLLSTDAIRPMSCRVRLAFDALIRRVRLYLVVAAALVGLLAYARAALRAKRAESRRVAELVQLALERLQEQVRGLFELLSQFSYFLHLPFFSLQQEYAHAVDPVLTPEPYLAPSHLRDHILRAEHSARARARLWTRVARVVEENANVRTRQAQRRGEWLRVWEWVGPVGTGMSRATGGASASASASAIEDTLMRATDREMVGYGSSPATSPIKMTDSERQSQRHFVA